MCCHGCEAVAQAIVASGMESYYSYRTEAAPKAREVVPAFLEQLRAYDNPVVQQRFVHRQDDLSEVSLILEGIVCAACVWLNERHLQALPGVVDVSINYSNHRALVRWDPETISLSEILESISRIGYLAHPYDPDRQQRVIEDQRKQQLRRIGLAGRTGVPCSGRRRRRQRRHGPRAAVACNWAGTAQGCAAGCDVHRPRTLQVGQ